MSKTVKRPLTVSEAGGKGGSVWNPKKKRAVLRNLKKARAARWPETNGNQDVA